jgi:hypothetical protein
MGPAVHAGDTIKPQRRPAMATVEPTEYTTILETIRHWPPDARRGLVRELVKSLAPPKPLMKKVGPWSIRPAWKLPV